MITLISLVISVISLITSVWQYIKLRPLRKTIKDNQ